MPETDGEAILKNLNAALKSKKLYPAGHPAFTTPVKKTHQLVAEAVKTKKSFVIGLINEAIVVEDNIVPESDKLCPEVVKYMLDKNVNAILFEKGVAEKEVTGVIDVLTGPKMQGTELQKDLHAKGVIHITLKSVPMGKRNVAEVYSGAVETVKNVMHEVRMGKLPKSEPVNTVVEEITESVLSDPNAVLGLTMIKNYDNYLYNHCVNVSIMSLSLGKAMNLDKMELHAVGVAALLHDIGKTGVSEDIIRKPGGLSSEEWEKLKQHPELGSNIVRRMEKMVELVSRLVYEHHIRYDRSGYPQTDGALHPFSQIISICDAYDALTTLRVYQRPHNPVEALKIMMNLSGKHFNPDTLKRFSNMIGLYPIGTIVRLSTNELGVVTKLNPDSPYAPAIKVLIDAEGGNVKEPFDLDLAQDEKSRKIIAAVNPATVNIDLGKFFTAEAERAASANA